MSSGKANISYTTENLEKPITYEVSQEPIFEKLSIPNISSTTYDRKLTKCYGKIINIHFFLSNNKELTNNQKLDYCTIERHFMKLYLKEMMKKM